MNENENENQPQNPSQQNFNQALPPQLAPQVPQTSPQGASLEPVVSQSPIIEDMNQQNSHGPTQPDPHAGKLSKMFNGRIGRLGYFLGPLYLMVPFILLLIVVFLVLPLISSGDMGGSNPVSTVLSIVVYLIGAVFMVIYILAIVSLHVRRLHDLNLPWVWILLTFIPIVSFFFGLYLLFAPGNKGANQYGEPVTSLDYLTVLGFKQPQ